MVYGAVTVKTTGACVASELLSVAVSSMFRKNNSADLGWVESDPEATVISPVARLVNPAFACCDQRIGDLRVPEAADAIERTHARVALTVSEMPCVDALGVLLPTTAVGENETAPTWTFTRGGTVTLTV